MKPEYFRNRVLLYADSPLKLHQAASVLGKAGFRGYVVTSEEDFASSLAASGAICCALLVVDPDAEPSRDLVSRLRGAASTAGHPFVVFVLCARPPRGVEATRLELGVDQVLVEPFDPVEFAEQLARVLEGKRDRFPATTPDAPGTPGLVAGPGDEVRLSAALEVLERVAALVELREDTSGSHTERVSRLGVALGSAIGLSPGELELLEVASLYHDVGKLIIGDAVALKTTKLSADEFKSLQRHTTAGFQLLSGVGDPVFDCAAEIALTHHERWDGAGYPRGLRGEEIPLFGRIVALADFYDSLTHDRVYRRAVPAAMVIEMIRGGSGREFDPRLVEAFLGLAPELERILSAAPAAVTHGETA